MLEATGSLWEVHSRGYFVCIPTNGMIKSNGEAVMGAGLALQAARRFPELPRLLGGWLKASGNHVALFPKHRLFTFPTKEDWRNPSTLERIEQSARELVAKLNLAKERGITIPTPVYLPFVGCGLGGLRWEDVRAVLETILDDRFVALRYAKGGGE